VPEREDVDPRLESCDETSVNTLRGRLFVDGKLLTGTLSWKDGRIASVVTEGEIGGADLPVVAPGFIDLHVHGFGGFDPLEDVAGMALALARAGTTAFLPTLFPGVPKQLGADCVRLQERVRSIPAGTGARVVGAHLEGPFVNRLAAGALPPSDLHDPSVAALRDILGPATGDGRGIRTMTLAPELPGAADLVRELVASGVRVSLGHSRATCADARAAAMAGAVGATRCRLCTTARWGSRASRSPTRLCSPRSSATSCTSVRRCSSWRCARAVRKACASSAMPCAARGRAAITSRATVAITSCAEAARTTRRRIRAARRSSLDRR
jgi:hypothetical protein